MLAAGQPGPADLDGRQVGHEIGETRGAHQAVAQADGEDHRLLLALCGQALAVPVGAQRAAHVDQGIAVGFGQGHQARYIRLRQRIEAQGAALQRDRLWLEHQRPPQAKEPCRMRTSQKAEVPCRTPRETNGTARAKQHASSPGAGAQGRLRPWSQPPDELPALVRNC
ncbi:hypothetical protein D9M71_530030 [compost metagenome]